MKRVDTRLPDAKSSTFKLEQPVACSVTVLEATLSAGVYFCLSSPRAQTGIDRCPSVSILPCRICLLPSSVALGRPTHDISRRFRQYRGYERVLFGEGEGCVGTVDDYSSSLSEVQGRTSSLGTQWDGRRSVKALFLGSCHSKFFSLKSVFAAALHVTCVPTLGSESKPCCVPLCDPSFLAPYMVRRHCSTVCGMAPW